MRAGSRTIQVSLSLKKTSLSPSLSTPSLPLRPLSAPLTRPLPAEIIPQAICSKHGLFIGSLFAHPVRALMFLTGGYRSHTHTHTHTHRSNLLVSHGVMNKRQASTHTLTHHIFSSPSLPSLSPRLLAHCQAPRLRSRGRVLLPFPPEAAQGAAAHPQQGRGFWRQAERG
jgi:hypothetical protein